MGNRCRNQTQPRSVVTEPDWGSLQREDFCAADDLGDFPEHRSEPGVAGRSVRTRAERYVDGGWVLALQLRICAGQVEPDLREWCAVVQRHPGLPDREGGPDDGPIAPLDKRQPVLTENAAECWDERPVLVTVREVVEGEQGVVTRVVRSVVGLVPLNESPGVRVMWDPVERPRATLAFVPVADVALEVLGLDVEREGRARDVAAVMRDDLGGDVVQRGSQVVDDVAGDGRDTGRDRSKDPERDQVPDRILLWVEIDGDAVSIRINERLPFRPQPVDVFFCPRNLCAGAGGTVYVVPVGLGMIEPADDDKAARSDDREAPDTQTKTKGSAAEVIGTMGSSENLIAGPANDEEDR